MSENFTLPAGNVVADVEVQTSAISGASNSEFCVLVIPLQLHLRCPNSLGLSMDFREVRCRVSPFDQTYIAESRPALLNVRVQSDGDVPNHWTPLEIPLDQARLANINRLRSNGDVMLRLDLELQVDELIKVSEGGRPPNPAVWGLGAHHSLRAQVRAVIPRSAWVEKVLPATGFGKVHIIELPVVPIECCAGLKASFEALQQAQKLESQGFYREAVGKCRVALEPFFEMVEKMDKTGEKQKVPKLKASWQTRLGQATYEWLNAALGVVKGPANQAVHFSSTTFEQLEAQMLLTITTALVAYAIKTRPEEKS